MIQRGERLGLALEARQAFGVGRERVRQNLDRHLAAQRGVGGAPHLSHAAFAKGRGDLVDADLSTLLKVALSLSKGETGAGSKSHGRFC